MNSRTSQPNEGTPVRVMRSAPQATGHFMPAGQHRFDNQTLIRQFELAIAGSQTLDDLLAQLTQILCQQSSCSALWISSRDENDQFSAYKSLTDESADALWKTVAEPATALTEHLSRSRQIGSIPLPFSKTAHLVAAPLCCQSDTDSPIDFILLGCFETDDHSILRTQWLLGMATQAATNWFQHQALARSEQNQRRLAEALKLIEEISLTTNQTQAGIVIVNQFRQLLGVEQVALTIQNSIVAVSDVELVDHNNESNQLIQTACNQAMETGQPVVFPGADGSATSPQLALETYCREHRMEACVNLPLKNGDAAPSGGLLIAGPQERLANPAFAEHAQKLIALISGQIEIVLRANRSIRELASEKVNTLAKHRWRKPAGIAILGMIAMLAIPMPYRIACDCELQPVLRRFVAAPYEGILEETLVENGVVVQKGQLLARLDGRNLRVELVGLQAELSGAKKRRDSALATGDIAQSQIARSETERLQSKIELLEQRTENLDIRSPIAGVIVSGDLEKVEGAPLKMGQTLFEVAPLEEMVSEIAIPESEIRYARTQMNVSIKLNAFPFKTWTSTIEQINPRSEMVDNESVFIAKVRIDNNGDALRPGMKGAAKIKSQWAPIGWNLFHHPWEAVRYWTIW